MAVAGHLLRVSFCFFERRKRPSRRFLRMEWKWQWPVYLFVPCSRFLWMCAYHGETTLPHHLVVLLPLSIYLFLSLSLSLRIEAPPTPSFLHMEVSTFLLFHLRWRRFLPYIVVVHTILHRFLSSECCSQSTHPSTRVHEMYHPWASIRSHLA